MPVEPFSFGVEARPGRYGPDGGARIINGYAEEAPAGAKVPVFIYCRPALTSFASLSGAGGYRGGIDLGATGLVVVGRTLHRVDSGGASIGTWGFAGDGRVYMARNRKSPNFQVALCCEGERFIWDVNGLNPIADTDLSAAICVFFQGGNFVWLLPDGRFQISSIDEGTEYDASEFATAEGNPDGLVGGIDMGQQIMLAGQKSVEFFSNTGNADFPYEAVQNVALALGCLSGHTIKAINGVPIFVASDATVRMLDGYQPKRISTHDVERAIEGLADKSTLRAFTFAIEGHQFYVLKSNTFTWVCDLLTRLWFEWKTYNADYWKAEGFLEIDGQRIVGHDTDAALYELDRAGQMDVNDYLIWELISQPFGQFPNRVIVDEFYVNLLPGVGLNSSDEHESIPQAMLRTSDDDSFTWSDEMTAEVGRIGEKLAQTSFTGLGASQEDGFRFRLSVSAPVSRAWMGSAVRYQAIPP